MSNTNYFEALKNEVQKIIGKDYEVSTQEVNKQEETVTAILIRKVSENTGLAFYPKEEDIGTVAALIVESYFNTIKDRKWATSIKIESWDEIKDKIIFKIINPEFYKEFLKDKVTMPFLDLVITFEIHVKINEDEYAVICISEDLLKIWNVNVETLYEFAAENTPRIFPANITKREKIANITHLYYFSNSSEDEHSAVILYPGFLEDFANELNNDLIIVSIDDRFCAFANVNEKLTKNVVTYQKEWMKEMQLAITGSTYHYDRKNNKITKM